MVCAEYRPIARVVDLGKMDRHCIPGYDSLDMETLAKEHNPFDGALELCPYFNYLRNSFHLDTVIETGCGAGKTTAFFGSLFDEVHTTDIDIPMFEQALISLRPYSNIIVHYGRSPDILRQILPAKSSNRILFYLDAHAESSEKWPLLEELKIISQTHRDHCVVVINDIKVPGRNDIPYRTWAGQECSYDYVKAALDEIFSSYVYYYIIPKEPLARAKLVIIPRKGEFSGGWAQ